MLDGPGCSDSMPRAVASIVWTLAILWLFLAIAIVCDDFFVASLEVISEVASFPMMSVMQVLTKKNCHPYDPCP